jgi:hypothetical protein
MAVMTVSGWSFRGWAMRIHLLGQKLEGLDRKADLLDLVDRGPDEKMEMIEGHKLQAVTLDRGPQGFDDPLQGRLLGGITGIFSPRGMILPSL